MRDLLTRFCAPILNLFENESDEFNVTPKNRWICNAISGLFMFLAAVVFFASGWQGTSDYLFPAVVFAAVGVTGLIVGVLGSDYAVAKLLGARKTR
ncbi:MAG: hypothetical protein HOM55_06165 [Proteobacteria bacterium]|jgi:hypothetical protein|nr:hypothetical protein [Pseudomonadota bacterium]